MSNALPLPVFPGNARTFWYSTLVRLTSGHLESATTNQSIPNAGETVSNQREGFARSIFSLMPWLSLADADIASATELQSRDKTRKRVRDALNSYFEWPLEVTKQDVIEAGHLSLAYLNHTATFEALLTEQARPNFFRYLSASSRLPYNPNNWALMAGVIELAKAKAGLDAEWSKLSCVLNQTVSWYKGDSWYGDGADFQLDYYNSLVIYPALTCIFRWLPELTTQPFLLALSEQEHEKRAARHLQVLERFIDPHGSFPVLGRSALYRAGNFFFLAYAAVYAPHYLDIAQLPAAQLRTALTAVMKRFDATYDQYGFYPLSFVTPNGSDPSLAEPYMSTGSMATGAFPCILLGLPATSELWAGEDQPWTSHKLWSGLPVQAASSCNTPFEKIN